MLELRVKKYEHVFTFNWAYTYRGTEKRYYVFKVRQDANKTELMKAVEKIFNVHPLDCKIINVKPKKKNRRMSRRGYTRSYKKAIIVLDGKESIDIVK